MALILEIEYLSGVCFAAVGPDSSSPDWPPQPDRIFSALVATWAARGQNREESDALEWLEKQDPPRIFASDAEPRSAPPVYVPPNDYETPTGELSKLKWYRDFLAKGTSPPEAGGHKKLWLQAWNVMPDQRKRSGLKERSFPASRPRDPVVRLLWTDAAPGDETFAALKRLAHDTAYIGHSASLTRCQFLPGGDACDLGEAHHAGWCVYAGRLNELRHAYARFEKSADKKDRPQKGIRVVAPAKPTRERLNVFDQRWLVLEHVAEDMPDLRACAIIAKNLRDALLSGYQRSGLGHRIPAVLSGHMSDGRPAREPHLAILPLAFVGFPYADGHVVGFALVPPRGNAILNDEDFRRAMRTLAPLDEKQGRRVLTIKPKEGTRRDQTFCLQLSPTLAPGKRSLDASLYLGPARTFATITPIVLDRHLKENGAARQDEIARQVAVACRNIGLPEPEQIIIDKHSAIEGAPSAYPSGKSPSWMHWRIPSVFASRQLTHAVIRFAEPVEGPVVLGAGRFVGLGFCRPLDAEEQ